MFFFQFIVRQFLEKMGQIAFFRSGNEPIVLNEQQRNSRREACIKQLTESKSINNRFSQNIPNLGIMQLQGKQEAIDSEITEPVSESNSDRQSLIIRNNECVICMDNQRGKFLQCYYCFFLIIQFFSPIKIVYYIHAIIFVSVSNVAGCC